MGAKVIVPDKHGYGNAYRFLFEEASGDYVVMDEGDNTYDFADSFGHLNFGLGIYRSLKKWKK